MFRGFLLVPLFGHGQSSLATRGDAAEDRGTKLITLMAPGDGARHATQGHVGATPGWSGGGRQECRKEARSHGLSWGFRRKGKSGQSKQFKMD